MKRHHSLSLLFIGLCGFLLTLAFTVDYQRSVTYMFSDEFVYYMMAQSFAYDQDLEYTQQDLSRVYQDGWHAGPQGVFLTKADDGKIYYSKSFVYALFLAPFLAVFGMKGFLLLNMLLLMGMIWMGWAYLRQFNASRVSLLVSATFFLLSASFIYAYWITPETFNMFCITLGLFLWLYQREQRTARVVDSRSVSEDRTSGLLRLCSAPLRGLAWLVSTPEGRLYLAPIPIGLACASKLPNALFILPIVADVLFDGVTQLFRTPGSSSEASPRAPLHWRSGTLWRALRRLLLICALFWGVFGLFYGLQYVFTGHFNPYAGDRKTFYWTFPFSSFEDAWERGIRLSNDDYFQESFFFHPRTLLYNIYYYFFGRFTGVLPYFTCAFLALYYFLRALLFRTSVQGDDQPNRGRSVTGSAWRRIALFLTICASVLAYIIMAPSNYQGGGGAFGNRFFLNIYPAFLFLITAISSLRPFMVCWLVGSLFLAQPLMTPFQSSYAPAVQAFRMPYRWLPVELTLVDTLPTNVNQHLMQTIQTETPAFREYFVDENIYDMRDQGSFWVRGKRTAELVLRTADEQPHLLVTVTNGLVGNQVDVTVAGVTQTVDFTHPRETRHLVFPLTWSMPYFKTHLYSVKIRSHTGYIPKFTPGNSVNDQRFLGCWVQLTFNPLRVAKAYVENGQASEAIALLKALVTEHPESLDLHYWLAKAYAQTRNAEALLQELNICQALLPGKLKHFSDECEDHEDECLAFTPEGAKDLSLFAKFLSPATRRYEAEKALRNTGEPISQPGVSQGEVVAYDPARHTPDYLVYGQFTPYAPGQYQARFRMRIRKTTAAQAEGTAVAFDVYHKRRGIIGKDLVFLDQYAQAASSDFKDYTINFDLDSASELEFRVKILGEARVDVDYVDVYPRLPLELTGLFAQAHRLEGNVDAALPYLQQLFDLDPWTAEIRHAFLDALFEAQRWEQAVEVLSSAPGISESHTGIASALQRRLKEDDDSAVQSYFERLSASFAPAMPLNASFNETIALLGYTLSSDTVAPGETFTIEYFWKALRQMEEDYSIFVHFTRHGMGGGADWLGKLRQRLGMPVTNRFQQDHQPLQGTYPTSSWYPEEQIREHYQVSVPATLEPGDYDIWIGVWNPLTNTRLRSGGQTKVHLGTLQVKRIAQPD